MRNRGSFFFEDKMKVSWGEQYSLPQVVILTWIWGCVSLKKTDEYGFWISKIDMNLKLSFWLVINKPHARGTVCSDFRGNVFLIEWGAGGVE